VRILAIETSAEQCSVALTHTTGVAQHRWAAAGRVSENALALVAQLLAEQSIDLGQVNAFAFGSGPGAFTGLRVACALVQGLAFGADRPVIAIGSLRALAHGAARSLLRASEDPASPVRVLAATDARMGQIYWAVYEGQVAERTLAEPALAVRDEMADHFARWRPNIVVGDALRMFEPAWPARFQASRMPHLVADASMVAELARIELAAGRTIAPRDAAPEYVRNRVALTVAQRAPAGGTVR